jgi:hypothetical protein
MLLRRSTWWLIQFGILAALGLVSYPFVIGQKRKADFTSAISNLRGIGFCLLDFHDEYGRLPDRESARMLREEGQNEMRLEVGYSNDYFRQLMISGICPNELIFYAKTSYTHKADESKGAEGEWIGPGECGYGYVMDGERSLKVHEGKSWPLAMAPLLGIGADVSNWRFDMDEYENRAAVLLTDNSVRNYRLDARGVPCLGETRRIPWDQIGEGTIWGLSVRPRLIPPRSKWRNRAAVP